MKILYLGCGHASIQAFDNILKNKINVAGLVLSNVPSNIPSEDSSCENIKKSALEFNIKIYSHKELINAIEEVKPELIVVNNYIDIIPSEVVNSYRCINVHYALLPQYRGLHATQWALINCEKEVGFTIYFMTDGIDDGDILYQEKITVNDEDDINSIYSKLNNQSAEALPKVIEKIRLNTYNAVPQNENNATYVQRRYPSDGLINWNSSSLEIFNLIRVLVSPYPGAYTYYKNKKLIIWNASLYKSPSYKEIPGRIVKIENDGILVKTKDGVLKIEKIQYFDNEIQPANLFFKKTGIRLGISMNDLIQKYLEAN